MKWKISFWIIVCCGLVIIFRIRIASLIIFCVRTAGGKDVAYSLARVITGATIFSDRCYIIRNRICPELYYRSYSTISQRDMSKLYGLSQDQLISVIGYPVTIADGQSHFEYACDYDGLENGYISDGAPAMFVQFENGRVSDIMFP